MTEATDYVRKYVLGPTVVNPSTDSTPDSQTDVIVRDANYQNLCGLA